MTTKICPVMSRAVTASVEAGDYGTQQYNAMGYHVPCVGSRCAWWVGRPATGVGKCAQAPNATAFPDPAHTTEDDE